MGLDSLRVLVALNSDKGALGILLARQDVPAKRTGVLAVDGGGFGEGLTEGVLLSLWGLDCAPSPSLPPPLTTELDVCYRWRP